MTNPYLWPSAVTRHLTQDEQDALSRVSQMLGPRWKSLVRAAWSRGNYKATGVSSEDYWALQSVRNKLSSNQFARLQRMERYPSGTC